MDIQAIIMFPKISSKIAGLSAIASAIVIFLNIAIISKYTNNFQLFGSWLSDLGTGNYAYIFNPLLALSAILLVPFGTYLFRQLGRKEHMRATFLLTALFLVLISIFHGNYSFHRPLAYAFFILAAVSLLMIGWNLKNKFGNVTIILVLWTLAGIAFISPMIETAQAFIAILWLLAAGVHVFRGRVRSA